MKRLKRLCFLLLFLATLPIIGCASVDSRNSRVENPYLKNAIITTGTIAPAVYGYRQAGPLGALAGWVLGNQLTNAALWKPSEGGSNTEVVYVTSAGYPYPYGHNPYYYPPTYDNRPVIQYERVGRSAAPARDTRLTVENYLEKGAVPEECQTKNWGVAAICLRRWAQELASLQARCLAGERSLECEENPGVVSREAYDLADALERKQEDAQGGKFVSR